jgi:cytochrome c5
VKEEAMSDKSCNTCFHETLTDNEQPCVDCCGPVFDRGNWRPKIAESQPGTLRDTFAAAALTGLLANPEEGSVTSVSAQAYRYADAMLAAREVRHD